MFIKLVCDPPLGQPTVVPEGDQVNFTVLIETSADSGKSFEVVLWHARTKDDWIATQLEAVNSHVESHLNSLSSSKGVHRQYFAVSIRPTSSSNPLPFTIRFRSSGADTWLWARDQFEVTDGSLLIQPRAQLSDELSTYIGPIDDGIEISTVASDTPDTKLWYLTTSAKPAWGDSSGWTRHTLGIPVALQRWFALVRLWSPWLAPRQGKGMFEPDKDTIMASFLRSDGNHIVILAISGTDDVLTILTHDGSGRVVIQGQNDATSEGVSKVVVAVGKSFETANAAAMYYARNVVMRYELSDEMYAEVKALEEAGPEPQWLQEWYDGLTYCTWNGLGQHLTEDRIFGALESLRSNDITVTNLIIDDNWQSLSNVGADQFQQGWQHFEANKEGFPNGLKYTTSKIRKDNPSIQHIAVWHALLGYWGGIDPNGHIAKEYGSQKVHMRNGVAGGDHYVVPGSSAGRLYTDFYRFLSENGIDSVKTDAQFIVDEVDQAPARRTLIKEYQDAWTIANLRYLGAKAISCMSQTPQMIFHSQLPNNKPRLLLRNSDDFFPEVPASHPWHIFCNAHNSLLTQHLNILPDWDMFQTVHDFSHFHAAARCVSGGPIYITDEPGKHNIELIKQMTGKTARGDTVILRPHVVGKSTYAYATYDEAVLLKIATYSGAAETGTSVLGLFNVTNSEVTELLNLKSFPGTAKGSYIVRSHTSGKISTPFTAGSNTKTISVMLSSHAWDIVSAIPLNSFELERKSEQAGPTSISIGNLGLIGKMTGSAAIVRSQAFVESESGRLRIQTGLKALGRLGLFVSDLSERDVDADFLVLVAGKVVDSKYIEIDKENNVLETDIETAWGQEFGGWNNEISVEVIIR